MILGFDFSKICTQGAYFSSFTASSLQDYLDEPIIPESSRYHSVGCSPSLLKILALMDTFHIVQKYKDLFASRETIIDLLLPYYEASECKCYLGRFIIFRGQLLGIRLNTAKNIFFNSWTEQKVKIVRMKDNEMRTNILVGQFSLHLPSLRIGLLFGDQVNKRSNQYINHGFDVVILMSQENQDDLILRSKINEISMKLLSIEIKSKEKFQNIQMKHITCLSQGSLHWLSRNKMQLAYYTFDKIYANKQRLQPQQKPLTVLQVDLELFQAEGSLYYEASMYPHCSLQEQLKTANCLNKHHQLYISRILNMFSFSQGNKLILVVEQSPTFLCLLFILRDIFGFLKDQISQCINRLFRLVGKTNRQLDFLLMRSKVIDPKDVHKLQDLQYKTLESYWLQILSEIGSESQHQWFAILAKASILQGVVELLNKRNIIDNSAQSTLQTWLIYEFFSYEELVHLYFSQEMKQFIGDEQYLIHIWNKNPSLSSGLENRSKSVFNANNSKLLIDQKRGNRSPEQILDYNNEIYYQFERWLAKNNSTACRQNMFSHFWFRNIGVVRPSYSVKYQHFTLNIDQQLLALPKNSLIEVISQLRQPFVNPLIQLDQSHHRKYLTKTQSENWKSPREKCHSCVNNFQKSQLYGCRQGNCGQNFCYECLLKNNSCQPENLLKLIETPDNRQAELILFPKCQGLCSNSCLSCLKNKIRKQTTTQDKSGQKKIKGYTVANQKQTQSQKRKQSQFRDNKVGSIKNFQFKNRHSNQDISDEDGSQNGESKSLENEYRCELAKQEEDEETHLSKLKEKLAKINK